jgi:prevent-host-death family protein
LWSEPCHNEVSMKEVAISEFKAKCLALLERVRRTRQPLIVTRHGKAIAEVIPPAPPVDRRALFGSMKDRITIRGDIVAPAMEEDDWEVHRE